MLATRNKALFPTFFFEMEFKYQDYKVWITPKLEKRTNYLSKIEAAQGSPTFALLVNLDQDGSIDLILKSDFSLLKA